MLIKDKKPKLGMSGIEGRALSRRRTVKLSNYLVSYHTMPVAMLEIILVLDSENRKMKNENMKKVISTCGKKCLMFITEYKHNIITGEKLPTFTQSQQLQVEKVRSNRARM